jgi:ribosomal protein L32E
MVSDNEEEESAGAAYEEVEYYIHRWKIERFQRTKVQMYRKAGAAWRKQKSLSCYIRR